MHFHGEGAGVGTSRGWQLASKDSKGTLIAVASIAANANISVHGNIACDHSCCQ